MRCQKTVIRRGDTILCVHKVNTLGSGCFTDLAALG